MRCRISYAWMMIVMTALCLLTSANASADPEFKFLDKRVVNAGKVRQGEQISASIRYTNDGTGRLFVLSCSKSCNCTGVTYTTEGLEYGEEGSVNVSVDTGGKSGPQTIIVRLLTNGSDEEEIIRIDFDVRK